MLSLPAFYLSLSLSLELPSAHSQAQQKHSSRPLHHSAGLVPFLSLHHSPQCPSTSAKHNSPSEPAGQSCLAKLPLDRDLCMRSTRLPPHCQHKTSTIFLSTLPSTFNLSQTTHSTAPFHSSSFSLPSSSLAVPFSRHPLFSSPPSSSLFLAIFYFPHHSLHFSPLLPLFFTHVQFYTTSPFVNNNHSTRTVPHGLDALLDCLS